MELGSGTVSVSGIQRARKRKGELMEAGCLMDQILDGKQKQKMRSRMAGRLLTPAEKLSSKPSISPEDATATMQATGRMLFVEGK